MDFFVITTSSGLSHVAPDDLLLPPILVNAHAWKTLNLDRSDVCLMSPRVEADPHAECHCVSSHGPVVKNMTFARMSGMGFCALRPTTRSDGVTRHKPSLYRMVVGSQR